jgi:hypothetical protein
LGTELSVENLLDHLDLTPHWLLMTPVSELGLSVRPTNVLGRAQILYIWQLQELGAMHVLHLRHMGVKSFTEVCEKIINLLSTGNCRSRNTSNSQVKELLRHSRQEVSSDGFIHTEMSSQDSVCRELLSEQNTRLSWFSSLIESQPEISQECERFGIVDIESYLRLESTMPPMLRLTVAHFRYESIVGTNILSSNVLDNLVHTPSWLLETSVSEIGLSARPTNILFSAEIETIGDFIELGSLGVFRLRHMGISSHTEICNKLAKLFLDGTLRLHNQYKSTNNFTNHLINFDVATNNIENTKSKSLYDSFLECWNHIQKLCDARELEIVKYRRLKDGRSVKTLTEIGRLIGLSRERVRQIESRSIHRILHSSAWSIITNRISRLLDSRRIPLTVAFIDREDDWFIGLEFEIETFSFLLNHDPSAQIFTLDLAGELTFTTVSVADWLDIKNAALIKLEQCEYSLTTRQSLYEQVVADIQYCAPELADCLWVEVTASSVWATNSDGDQVFLTTDTSVESLIRCVLELSLTPLHYTTIHEKVNNLDQPKKFDLFRVHNVLVESFILYGPGTYGLEKHCPLTELECEHLSTRLKVLIDSGPLDKQWHSHELFDTLKLESIEYNERLTSHVISYLLSKSPHVVGLRRMVWGIRGHWHDTAEARIDVSSVISGILISAGGPLTTKEIRDRAVELRGLSNVFQVHSKYPVIQVGPRLWGIEGRDANVQLYESLIRSMRSRLVSIMKPTHFSTMKELVPKDLKVNFYTLNVVCRREGVVLDQGYYLTLQEWDQKSNPVIESVTSILSQFNSGIAVREIHKLLERDLRHPVERQYLSDLLQDIGATYDSNLRLWYLN